MKKITTEIFINNSENVHGNIYNYENVKYINAKTKVTINCSIHGDFEITPNKHLSGGGCQKCGRLKVVNSKTKSHSDFLIEVKNIHGDLYDYSEVEFKVRSDKIKIKCKVHGEFNQTVSNHLSGQGCPKCAEIKKGLNRRKNGEDFFSDCNHIHRNEYDYSKTEYTDMYSNIEPICKKHGKFIVKATKHYHRRQGCPKCSSEQICSKAVNDIKIFLIENNIEFIQEYKISDCKNILPLPFDFYLPKYNLLIEYDGIQHYKAIEFFGGHDGLKEQQKNDLIKTNYCKNNGIELLRIRYDEDHIDILSKMKF